MFHHNQSIMTRLVLFIVTTLGMIWVVYEMIIWMYMYCDHPLSHIVVTGNRQLTTNQDIQTVIAQIETLGTFITQDVQIVQKFIEQLPWIKQVSIRKQWPSTLKIHLVEHIPVAYWNDNLVISREGIVFKMFKNCEDNDDCHNINIPTLYGPSDKVKDVLYNYIIFKEILKSNIFCIRSIRIDSCYSWQLVLENNICLRLGRNNMIERLLYFIKIYPMLLQKMYECNKYIDYVDLRYRSGFAVKWMDNVMIIPAL